MRILTVLCVTAMLLTASVAGATVFLYEGFESGGAGWESVGGISGAGSLWHAESYRSSVGGYSAAYNTGYPDYDYDVGWSWGRLESPVFDLSSATAVGLSFDSWLLTEAVPVFFDDVFVMYSIGGDEWFSVPGLFVEVIPEWITYDADLSFLAGESAVKLGFMFDSVDGEMNHFEGWYLDEITVAEAGSGSPVPEPSTMLLLSSGLAGGAFFFRRRRNS